MKVGRHPKRSPERETAILNALRVGNTRRASASAGDISHETFYTWLEDLTFLDAVKKAENEAEQRFLGQVAQAAKTNWQAAAWWLERRKHEDFSRREKVDMTLDAKKDAERVAAGLGLDAEAVLAEAERIVKESAG